MKQARSIFLGGDLIDITQANHSDYFNKGLICPFCLEKVFFAKEFERVVDGKIVKVSASFRHHKGDPLSCELRSQSSEGKDILKAISSESREQRKPIWEKYLWAMFKAGVYANKDISRFGLSEIGKLILDTPIAKPINLKFLVDEHTPKHKYITVEEMGFALSYCFALLPFNYDYYQEYIKSCDKNIAEQLRADLSVQLDDLINISNKIEQAIKAKDFYEKSLVKTNPSLHHSICMEVFKTLAKPQCQIHERLLVFMFLNVNESHPMPKEPLLGLRDLVYMLRECKGLPNQEQILATRDIQHSLLNFLFYVYAEQIITIDWYKLSQQPWQNLAHKSDILKIVPATAGKGFGKPKHKK